MRRRFHVAPPPKEEQHEGNPGFFRGAQQGMHDQIPREVLALQRANDLQFNELVADILGSNEHMSPDEAQRKAREILSQPAHRPQGRQGQGVYEEQNAQVAQALQRANDDEFSAIYLEVLGRYGAGALNSVQVQQEIREEALRILNERRQQRRQQEVQGDGAENVGVAEALQRANNAELGRIVAEIVNGNPEINLEVARRQAFARLKAERPAVQGLELARQVVARPVVARPAVARQVIPGLAVAAQANPVVPDYNHRSEAFEAARQYANLQVKRLVGVAPLLPKKDGMISLVELDNLLGEGTSGLLPIDTLLKSGKAKIFDGIQGVVYVSIDLLDMIKQLKNDAMGASGRATKRNINEKKERERLAEEKRVANLARERAAEEERVAALERERLAGIQRNAERREREERERIAQAEKDAAAAAAKAAKQERNVAEFTQKALQTRSMRLIKKRVHNTVTRKRSERNEKRRAENQAARNREGRNAMQRMAETAKLKTKADTAIQKERTMAGETQKAAGEATTALAGSNHTNKVSKCRAWLEKSREWNEAAQASFLLCQQLIKDSETHENRTLLETAERRLISATTVFSKASKQFDELNKSSLASGNHSISAATSAAAASASANGAAASMKVAQTLVPKNSKGLVGAQAAVVKAEEAANVATAAATAAAKAAATSVRQESLNNNEEYKTLEIQVNLAKKRVEQAKNMGRAVYIQALNLLLNALEKLYGKIYDFNDFYKNTKSQEKLQMVKEEHKKVARMLTEATQKGGGKNFNGKEYSDPFDSKIIIQEQLRRRFLSNGGQEPEWHDQAVPNRYPPHRENVEQPTSFDEEVGFKIHYHGAEDDDSQYISVKELFGLINHFLKDITGIYLTEEEQRLGIRIPLTIPCFKKMQAADTAKKTPNTCQRELTLYQIWRMLKKNIQVSEEISEREGATPEQKELVVEAKGYIEKFKIILTELEKRVRDPEAAYVLQKGEQQNANLRHRAQEAQRAFNNHGAQRAVRAEARITEQEGRIQAMVSRLFSEEQTKSQLSRNKLARLRDFLGGKNLPAFNTSNEAIARLARENLPENPGDTFFHNLCEMPERDAPVILSRYCPACAGWRPGQKLFDGCFFTRLNEEDAPHNCNGSHGRQKQNIKVVECCEHCLGPAGSIVGGGGHNHFQLHSNGTLGPAISAIGYDAFGPVQKCISLGGGGNLERVARVLGYRDYARTTIEANPQGFTLQFPPMAQLANRYAYIVRESLHGRKAGLNHEEREILRRIEDALRTCRWTEPIVEEVQASRAEIEARVRAGPIEYNTAVNDAAEEAELVVIKARIKELEAQWKEIMDKTSFSEGPHEEGLTLLKKEINALKFIILGKLSKKQALAEKSRDEKGANALLKKHDELEDEIYGPPVLGLLNDAVEALIYPIRCLAGWCSKRAGKGGFTRRKYRYNKKGKKRARTSRLKN